MKMKRISTMKRTTISMKRLKERRARREMKKMPPQVSCNHRCPCP